MQGTFDPKNISSVTNILEFWFKNKLLGINTALPVKVLETNSDATVDVELMILGVNADNEALEALKVYNCPYLTLGFGKSAIRIEPKKDDIGLMVFCQRDISTVVETKKTAIPDTFRKFNLSDGVYIPSLFYDFDTAESIIEITDESLTIKSKEIMLQTEKSTLSLENSIVLESDTIDLTSNVDINIESQKVITLANSQNAVSILKEVAETLATACSLPTAPGQPVITPADLVVIQTKLALLAGFE